MNAAHLHLILNHFPVMGLIIAAVILAGSLWQRSEELARVGLILLAVVAIVAIAVYLTGEPAEEILHEMPGVNDDLIHSHEDAGKIALFLLEFLGAAAVVGLVAFRGPNTQPRWFTPTLLALCLIVLFWVGWTSYLGGQISHPEARPDFVVPEETGENHEH